MALRRPIEVALAAIAAFAVVGMPSEARGEAYPLESGASESPAQAASGFLKMLRIAIALADLVSPEIGLEHDDELGMTLGWYPHMSLAVLTSSEEGSPQAKNQPIFRFTLLGGPQIETVSGEVRGLVAAAPQLWLFEHMMVAVEGGYTFGTDGSGPHIGVGIGGGASEAFAFVLTGRRTWLGDRHRHSAGIDLRIFWTDVWEP